MTGLVRLVGALVLAGALTLSAGCGKSQRESYCDALRTDRAELADVVGSGKPASLVDGLPLLRRLSDEAPSDLTDEWQTLVNAVTGLRDALKDAGLEPDAVSDGLPSSLTGAKRKAVVGAADELGSAEVLDAAQGIETQARDVCKVNIGA